MSQDEKDKKVAKYLADITQALPYFIDNDIMTSFDIKFKYGNNFYQLALIENGKVYGEDFKLSLN